ncbi:MAG: DedA family protein [Thermoplasmata archaeon]
MIVSMSFSIVSWIITQIISFLEYSGYFGVFSLMTLESMLLPIPSEVILPFAGYLVYRGSMNMILAILAGTLGGLAGSLISYGIGYYGGRPFIIKFGRYILIREQELSVVENWFKKYGSLSVFLTRLVPIFRTFISIPAGIGEMNILKFTIYTALGSLIWSIVLVYLGFMLGNNWVVIFRFFGELDYVVYAVAIAIILYLGYRAYKAWKK